MGAGRALAKAHLTPNALTTSGLVLTLGGSWLVAVGEPFRGGLVLIPAAILDVLDGALARATGRVTPWGGFYDSVADRIGDGALLAAIAWAARAGHDRLFVGALVAMVLSFLVPYARAKAESFGYTVRSGPGERAERAVILIAGLILGYVEAAVWVVAALAAWTFVGRCLGVRHQATR